MGTKERDLDWENRVLCSDESCIGVVGPDGRCKECGLAFEGELPQAVELKTTPVSEEEAPVSAEEVTVDKTPPLDPDDEWAQRTLCSDESCIGVIGPDGRCKECGKPYPG